EPSVSIPRPIVVTTNSASSASAFDGADDVEARSAEADPQANRDAVRGAEVVILGVKPWAVVDVAREIAADLAQGTIVVSVAAGVPSGRSAAGLPGAQVVRAMPDTPSHRGRGVTGVAGGPAATADAVDTVCRLFETVGDVVRVREDQINGIAAV